MDAAVKPPSIVPRPLCAAINFARQAPFLQIAKKNRPMTNWNVKNTTVMNPSTAWSEARFAMGLLYIGPPSASWYLKATTTAAMLSEVAKNLRGRSSQKAEPARKMAAGRR